MLNVGEKSWVLPFFAVIALAVFAHFKNNNEETKNKDVYFPNEIQWDTEQDDFQIRQLIKQWISFLEGLVKL